MLFEWDDNKNQQNIKKHDVDFNEAASVFFDEHALMIPDPDHSDYEERFLILGISKRTRLLTVCHCYRKSETVIRIISARKATLREEHDYNRRSER